MLRARGMGEERRAPRAGRATLATIAAAAGVSVTTVSKVLNDRDDVAPATRALVQDLLRRHYYVGRSPSRHPTAELVFHGPLTAYSNEIMDGVVTAATEVGVAIVVCLRPLPEPGEAPVPMRPGPSARPLADGHPTSPTAWALELAAAGRQAVISVTNEMTAEDIVALARAELPLVVIDPLSPATADVTSVGSTNYAGGVAAAQHLLALGHRRVAYLGGDPVAACNQARMHGFRGAMEAAGAPVPEHFVQLRRFRYVEGVAGGADLLDQPTPPTAIFAGNDEMAVGVIEAARARGLRVPDDLSVIGFDDTQVAQLSSPQLTTVRQPLREMGSVALRTALRLAAGARVDSHHVELATSLVVRDSTAPPSGPAGSPAE